MVLALWRYCRGRCRGCELLLQCMSSRSCGGFSVASAIVQHVPGSDTVLVHVIYSLDRLTAPETGS